MHQPSALPELKLDQIIEQVRTNEALRRKEKLRRVDKTSKASDHDETAPVYFRSNSRKGGEEAI